MSHCRNDRNMRPIHAKKFRMPCRASRSSAATSGTSMDWGSHRISNGPASYTQAVE